MAHKRLWWWLSSVLLLGALWWWLGMPRSWQQLANGLTTVQTSAAEDREHEPSSKHGTASASQQDLTATETTTESSPEDTPIPGSDWQQKLLQELEPRLFSDDPFVEVHSLEYVMGQCREQDVVKRLFVGNGPFYQAQQQLAKDLQQHCQQVQQQYPELLSYPDHKQLAQTFEPSSRLGQLLQQRDDSDLTHLDRRDLYAAILHQSIQERNGATLLEAVFVTRFGSMSNEAMAQVLGSRDTEYINQMSSLALMLLSCQYQGGRSCEPTSYYMIIMCSQTPAACGLDFPSWLEASTLPGMRRDIDRLMAHFSQFGS